MNSFSITHFSTPSHAYQMVKGRRADAINYLITRGVSPASAGAQLCAQGTIVTQYLANISWPNGQTVVPGCPTIHVQESSDGKSLLAQVTTAPLKHYIETLDIEGLPMVGGEETKNPFALIEDATREAVIDAMAEAQTVTLLTTEGSMVLPLMRKAATTLVKLVDGEGLDHARRGEGRISIGTEKRFSFHVQTQDGPFKTHAQHLRTDDAGTGLQNRTGFSYTPPLPTLVAPGSFDPSHASLRACIVRGMELVNETIKQVRTKAIRPKLRLTKEANDCLQHMAIQSRQAAQSYPPFLRTYLSRHAERALREAGSHHLFEYGIQGEITLATMQMADRFSADSFTAFCMLTDEPAKLTKQEENALTLENLIYAQAIYFGPRLSVMKLRSLTVNIGLTKGQFNAALPLLCVQGKVYVERDWLYYVPLMGNGWPRLSS